LFSGLCAHGKIGNLIGAWRVFKLSAYIDVGPSPACSRSGPWRVGLVLDKARRRFSWLEPIWADGGYSAGQVELFL
jgi:hypothetical protein